MAAALAGEGYLVTVPEAYYEFEPLGTVLAYDAEGSGSENPTAPWSDRRPSRQLCFPSSAAMIHTLLEDAGTDFEWHEPEIRSWINVV
jgi:hypothetical protein